MSVHNKQLKVFIANFRSLNNKISLLNQKLLEYDYDIFCGIETWLGSNVTNNFINESYAIFRRDRNERGGGVMIGVKNTSRFRRKKCTFDCQNLGPFSESS